ncbi:MAG TPA: hypothetical protein VFW38_01035 [Solirubrobacteraceae bacterium]|nr:hypothetical protein [Solirubrobacteraceae bacterium]
MPERALCRIALVILIVLCGTLSLTVGARADSASISVTNTAGQPDPAAGVPRVLTVSGDASVPEQVFVKFRAPGGAPCAPDASSDSGSSDVELLYPSLPYGTYVNGDFSLQNVYTWPSPGTYVFCIWLPKAEPYKYEDEQITQPIAQTITFRSPTGTISGTVSPVKPRPAERATLTVTGASESPERVFAKLRPSGGAGCAPTYEADSGESVIDDQQVNGSFDLQGTVTQSRAGRYLVCLWMAESAGSTPAIAGPQPLQLTVGASSSSRPSPASRACLRDRAEVGRQAALVHRYEARLRRRHLSKRSRRADLRALAGARHRLGVYESLRRHQCPRGR